MSKIREFFGLYCGSLNQDFKNAMEKRICPYTQKRCIKVRKSNPDIVIGTCSVIYQNQTIAICPFRMLEHNQIFMDCLHLLTLHEPGNELYLIPEVQIRCGYRRSSKSEDIRYELENDIENDSDSNAPQK